MPPPDRPIHAILARASVALGVAMLVVVPAISAPDPTAAGKPVFDRYCGRCHEIGLGAMNTEGPQLNGIIGMPAGNQRGYEYSPTTMHSSVIWTDASFLAFIADPRADMPGTRMAISGVASESDRRAILAYVSRFDSDGTLRERRQAQTP